MLVCKTVNLEFTLILLISKINFGIPEKVKYYFKPYGWESDL